jgi:hypothetical protein
VPGRGRRRRLTGRGEPQRVGIEFQQARWLGSGVCF